MSLMMIGASHHNTSMQILERLAIRASDQSAALQTLVGCHHINEALILSTCNRKELYLDVVAEQGGKHDVFTFYQKYCGVDRETLEQSLIVKSESEAAEHLYRVASGLESMVVGERQILMQIRQAFSQSLDSATSGPMLNKAFREAIHLGRVIRQNTDLGMGAQSTVSVALEHVVGKLPSDPRILVVGAGHIGGMVARTLAGLEGNAELWANPREVVIANRTFAKAEELAERIEESGAVGTAIQLNVETIATALAEVDMVVTSTDSNHPIITRDILEIVLPHRANEQLIMVDMAVPRDIDPGVATLPGVIHIDIEALRDLVVGGPTKEAITRAEIEVANRKKDFASWLRGVSVEPTIKALQLSGETIRKAETARLAKRLASLDDDQRNAVETLTKGIVKTLLHQPTITLKNQASTEAGKRYAQAIGVLFNLEVQEEE